MGKNFRASVQRSASGRWRALLFIITASCVLGIITNADDSGDEQSVKCAAFCFPLNQPCYTSQASALGIQARYLNAVSTRRGQHVHLVDLISPELQKRAEGLVKERQVERAEAETRRAFAPGGEGADAASAAAAAEASAATAAATRSGANSGGSGVAGSNASSTLGDTEGPASTATTPMNCMPGSCGKRGAGSLNKAQEAGRPISLALPALPFMLSMIWCRRRLLR